MIQFREHGSLFNPSCISPAAIGRNPTTGNAYLTVAGQPNSPAAFATVVMITTSNIVNTKEVFSEKRRVCTGIAHNVEWQCMQAMLLAALGEESANVQITQDSIMFSTSKTMSGCEWQFMGNYMPLNSTLAGYSPAKNPSRMFKQAAGPMAGGSVFARPPVDLQGIQTGMVIFVHTSLLF